MERIIDFITSKFIGGERLSGVNTKFGAAAGAVLAIALLLKIVAEALIAASEGHYWAAIGVLRSDEMAAAIAGLAAVKAVLGVRLAQDKVIVATIAAATATHQALPTTTVPVDVSRTIIEDSVRAAGVPLPPELVSTPVPRG